MLKRQGINEKDIGAKLNISDEIYEFFHKFRKNFSYEIEEIKKDLLLNLVETLFKKFVWLCKCYIIHL